MNYTNQANHPDRAASKKDFHHILLPYCLSDHSFSLSCSLVCAFPPSFLFIPVSVLPSICCACCVCAGQRSCSPSVAGLGSSCVQAPPSSPQTQTKASPSPPPHTLTLPCSERVCPSMRTCCSWRPLVLYCTGTVGLQSLQTTTH